MSLTDIEFASLRQTIAIRGTVRVVLLPLTLLGWSVIAGALMLSSTLPVAAIFPLAVLVGGFEAIHALHVGVERVGRYVQVSYETHSGGPRWETTAMAVGPTLPGGGIDPLFTAVFIGATVANLLPALMPDPTGLELAAISTLHAAVVVRMLRARRAAARQRTIELERYRAIRAQQDAS